jgi:hypothetical protein
MTTKADENRRREKAAAVADRITEMLPNLTLLIGMMDEHKLDAMILALGLGDVELRK